MPPRRTPRRAFTAALRRALNWAAGRRNIVGVGIGRKHRGGSYPGAEALCIKFFVARKLAKPAELIPESFRVRSGGKTYFVATDVEPMGRPRLHALACSCHDPDAWGSVGALLRGGNVRYAVTAGHVLDGCDYDVTIDGVARGKRVSSASSVMDAGRLLDIATVRLTRPLQAWSSRPPWNGIERIVPTPQLWREFPDDRAAPRRATVHGAGGAVVVDLDCLVYTPVRFENASIVHESPLLCYRARTGVLYGGASGSAVLDATGTRWLGLHVGGTSRVGYAHPAGRVHLAVAKALRRDVELLIE